MPSDRCGLIYHKGISKIFGCKLKNKPRNFKRKKILLNLQKMVMRRKNTE